MLLTDHDMPMPNLFYLARMALINEIFLTPKPGLVDMNNNGSHGDMDMATFLTSISAISSKFSQFYCYGWNNAWLSSATVFLTGLRSIGRQCEQAMFDSTNNINTHKGVIFAFGLILAAIGRLVRTGHTCNYKTIGKMVKLICNDLVERELVRYNKKTTTGERLYEQFQLTGARGEAQSGYRLVIDLALPVYFNSLRRGYNQHRSLLQAMLHLLAKNRDTNVVSRGGIEGLVFVQQYARNLLYTGGALTSDYRERLLSFDKILIEKNLSPGGTADLIAVTWFLSHYPAN